MPERQSRQAVLLREPRAILERELSTVSPSIRDEARFQVLEVTSSQLGGFDLPKYRHLTGSVALEPVIDIAALACRLRHSLRSLPFHPALALSALAVTKLGSAMQRDLGSWQTDFRLAKYVADLVADGASSVQRIIDPAVGTGMLLVAATLRLAGRDQTAIRRLLSTGVHGADLSPQALRGAMLALASLTDDVDTIAGLQMHLRQADSLIAGAKLWADVAPRGFDLLLANPPWRKLKVTKHEYLVRAGVQRHYGRGHDGEQEALDGLLVERERNEAYLERLRALYELQGGGDPDLYRLFTELSTRLVRPGGNMGLLLPAGLIRSKTTKPLRAMLFSRSESVRVSTFINQPMFFQIDHRFKFVVLTATRKNDGRCRPIEYVQGGGNDLGVEVTQPVRLARSTLRRIRADLTLPEVRTNEAWRIFQHMTDRGRSLGDESSPFRPRLCREVDMTKERPHFARDWSPNRLPLLEGRMVHQYRHDAKSYRSGSGRKSKWIPNPPDEDCRLAPQFWFPRDRLNRTRLERVESLRIGFCDVTGQTNERTLLAAPIPPGVVCGNKVPTATFPINDPDEMERVIWCWLAIANSLPIDWYLRRVVTTTINYFTLNSLPFPDIIPSSLLGRRLAELAWRLGICAHLDPVGVRVSPHSWEAAEARAEIDWRVLHAFGLGFDAILEMLTDFYLLDRSQPALPGEKASTITSDFLRLRACDGTGVAHPERDRWAERVAQSQRIGAVPYVVTDLHIPDMHVCGERSRALRYERSRCTGTTEFQK